jgi:hypothetical protein
MQVQTKTLLNRVINKHLTEEQKQELDYILKDLEFKELKHILKMDRSIKGVKIA